MSGRILVACVGNVLRGDDGFGVAVAERLAAQVQLPPNVDLVESGIGGLEIVHRLMDGYVALIVVDAVDREALPGTIFVDEPDVAAPESLTIERWRELFSNLHLAEPSRVLLLARSLGVLPERVLLVGCQAGEYESIGMTLSAPVHAAVAVAARRVRELAQQLIDERAVGGSVSRDASPRMRQR